MFEQLVRAAVVNLGYTALMVVLAVGLWKAVDRWLFPGIDFIPEIRRGNVAAAILAGVLLLFCAQLVSSGLN
jgi:predicted benzoate:H+ symporter BenE